MLLLQPGSAVWGSFWNIDSSSQDLYAILCHVFVAGSQTDSAPSQRASAQLLEAGAGYEPQLHPGCA